MKNRVHLSEFEQMVLLALIRLRPNAYGVPIHKELANRAGREVALAQIYSTLDRLQANGFAKSWVGDSTSERGGRAKRYFEITADGEIALNEARSAMTKMWEGIQGPKEGFA